MEKNCLKCAHLTEKSNGEHCGKCIRTAKDNFEPVNKKEKRDNNGR